MTLPKYGLTKNLGKINFETAVQKVENALKTEGFGILTEIDVKATLKKKLDKAFRNYKILGACNPPLAHQALSTELMVGLLLPCNAVVYEEDDGTITASLANPSEMFKIVDNPDLAGMADAVATKINRVFEQL